jgi:hypothetical protein
MTRSATQNAPAISPAGIEACGVYTLRDFMGRLKLGRHWMRSAKAAGLRVRSYGNRSFVAGADFVAFLESQKEDVA